MEDKTPLPESTTTATEQTTTTGEESSNLQRYVIIAAVVYIVIILAPFIIGLILAVADMSTAQQLISLMRDIFIIVLSMVSITIAVALAILVLQVAGLINLLQNEIQPILKDLQSTLNGAKGTVKFVGDNVTQPIIKAGGFFAGLSVFMREVGGIKRAVRKSDKQGDTDESQ